MRNCAPNNRDPICVFERNEIFISILVNSIPWSTCLAARRSQRFSGREKMERDGIVDGIGFIGGWRKSICVYDLLER